MNWSVDGFVDEWIGVLMEGWILMDGLVCE